MSDCIWGGGGGGGEGLAVVGGNDREIACIMDKGRSKRTLSYLFIYRSEYVGICVDKNRGKLMGLRKDYRTAIVPLVRQFAYGSWEQWRAVVFFQTH